MTKIITEGPQVLFSKISECNKIPLNDSKLVIAHNFNALCVLQESVFEGFKGLAFSALTRLTSSLWILWIDTYCNKLKDSESCCKPKKTLHKFFTKKRNLNNGSTQILRKLDLYNLFSKLIATGSFEPKAQETCASNFAQQPVHNFRPSWLRRTTEFKSNQVVPKLDFWAK